MSNRKKRRKHAATAPQEPPADEEAMLAALQTRSHQIAATWYQGIDLQYLGVDLGRCLAYPMIQNVNNAILNAMRGHDG